MRLSRRAVTPGLMLAAVGGRAFGQAAAWTLPDDAAIRKILAARIDAQHQGVGIVVGVIDASGRRIVSHGVRAKGDTRPLDGDTVFEIGSMTKVFTSLVLADMVRRGEVKLDDPVQKYLPAGVRVPERGGKQITLADLATHTSGLPSLPSNFAPRNSDNPYADYTVEQLWAYLNGYALTRDIGVQYAYSNMGVGLLGQALTRRDGAADYEDLVRRRVLRPLGLKDTAVTLSASMKARLAPGHDAALEPAANWDLPTFAGAGALRSTANDVLRFLADELGFQPTPLKAAMADEYTLARRRGPSAQVDVALGWHVSKFQTGEVVWHNGGTGGYRSFFGFDPKARIGAVVLTNAATPVGGDDIGMHLLAGRPVQVLDPPKPARKAISLTPDRLKPLVGVYAFTPQLTMTVTQEGAHLYAVITGQFRVELFPQSPTEFFLKQVDAQVRFEPDRAILRQNGRDQIAKRVAP